MSNSSRTAAGLVVTLWTSFGALAAQASPRVEFAGREVEAIDVHLHTGSFATLGASGRDFLLRTLPDFIPPFLKRLALGTLGDMMLDPYGAFIGIQQECTKAGLSMCGLMAVYAPETWGVTPNQKIHEAIANPKNVSRSKTQFFGYASLNVSDWQDGGKSQLEVLRQGLREPGMKAIKLNFIHNNVPLDDPRYDGIYEVAREFGVPVYHHVGSTPLRTLSSFPDSASRDAFVRSFDPAGLERAIAAFPNVTFILGHMGFDFNAEGFDFSPTVYELAHKYNNVILEISAYGRATYDPEGMFMDSVLRNVREQSLLERTIYGSDGPGNPGGIRAYLDSTLKSMARMGYTVSDAEKILSGNTRRIFRLPPSP